MAMLTNYYFEDMTWQTGGFANFCLNPLVTALGRKVTFRGQGYSWDKLSVEQHKTSHIAIRIIAGIGAVVLLPMTLLGLAARKLSFQHEYYQQQAVKGLARQEKAIELAGKMQELMGSKAESRQEKLQKALQLGHLIDANANHKVNEQQQIALVQELKKLLTEVVAGTSRDESKPWAQVDYTVKESFKAEITYDECLSLKRVLYRLAYHEAQYNFQEKSDARFDGFYKEVRKVYYDKFTGDHIVNNLRTKGKITAIDLEMGKLDDSTLQEIQKAYSAPVHPGRVTWLHGTESPTLVAMAKTDAQLKPGGMLRQEGQVIFCGENNQGWDGVNRDSISGGALDNLKTVLSYAAGIGIGKHEELGLACRKYPEPVLETYVSEFKRYAKELNETGHCPDFEGYGYDINGGDATNRHNTRRHLQIIATLKPELFKEKMVPVAKDLIAALQAHPFKGSELIIKEVLQPAVDSEKLPKNSPEEQAMIQNAHPVIFGATEIKLVQQIQGNETEKVALYRGGTTKEYLYRGALKMGADLQFLFVPNQKIDETRRYLESKNIHAIRVTNIEALKIAAQYEAFKMKKWGRSLITYYCDRTLKATKEGRV